jgi:uncharacterized protein YciI/ketosteroid isomerase-like protein
VSTTNATASEYATYQMISLTVTPGKSLSPEVIAKHELHLALLERQGKLLLAGPVPQRPGGLIVLQVENLDEARAIAEADPLVEGGFETYDLATWIIHAGRLVAQQGTADPGASLPGSSIPTAAQLLQGYLSSIQNPPLAAAHFADDGVLELPWVGAHVRGPVEVEKLIRGILTRVPTFSFRNVQFWIQTPDQVFAEYQVEAFVPETGKTYHQTYAGVLLAENGKIKLLREALNTAEAARAFSKEPAAERS